MPLSLPDLAKRATGEVERLLSSLIAQGQGLLSPGQEQRAEIVRLKAELAAQRRRADDLELRLAEQSQTLAAMSRRLSSLVGELNERLLPGIDERIHETERDLARLATRLLRSDQEGARRQNRLNVAEQRIADLRERTGRLEQRTAIWRELQANVARLGEDLDALRAGAAEPGRLAELDGELDRGETIPLDRPAAEREQA